MISAEPEAEAEVVKTLKPFKSLHLTIMIALKLSDDWPWVLLMLLYTLLKLQTEIIKKTLTGNKSWRREKLFSNRVKREKIKKSNFKLQLKVTISGLSKWSSSSNQEENWRFITFFIRALLHTSFLLLANVPLSFMSFAWKLKVWLNNNSDPMLWYSNGPQSTPRKLILKEFGFVCSANSTWINRLFFALFSNTYSINFVCCNIP